jgi:prepilin-type N-terminal cleavage/methylation domain-containing protein/prepilin-type processing-associated H-X9-DG protein
VRPSAFTLIELLVVIAIIALVAAILFPVFAQARKAARGAASLSNERQIALAILMYTQDYDETFPLDQMWGVKPGWCFGEACDEGSVDVVQFWSLAVTPYIRAYSLFQDPLAGSGLPSYAPDDSGWTMATQYGYNYQGLSPIPPDADLSVVPWRRAPTTLAAIRRPSEMVLLSEIATTSECHDSQVTFGDGALTTLTLAEAPVCTEYPDGPVCLLGWVADGWPAFLNEVADAQIGEEGGLYTGGVAFRKAGLGNFAFADGHVRFLTPIQAAAGTNWYKGITFDELKITDRDKYLWLP